MRTPILRSTAIRWLAGLCLATSWAVAQDELPKLLDRLATDRFDESAVLALEAHPRDPRIVPALEAAFERRQAKEEKQAIAVTLLRLGDKSEKYFNFLAGYAEAAVTDRTPFFVDTDANGRAIKGQFSAAFLNWCALNGADPKTVASRQKAGWQLFAPRRHDLHRCYASSTHTYRIRGEHRTR